MIGLFLSVHFLIQLIEETLGGAAIVPGQAHRERKLERSGCGLVEIAGSYSAGRVVQAPFGENRTYDQSYYIMKMELAKGKRKRDGPVQVLYRPHRSNVSQGRNKKESRQLTLETLVHQVEHCPQQSNLQAGISLLRSERFKPRNGGTSERFSPCSCAFFS